MKTSDKLFIIQITGIVIFTIAQFERMTHTVQGISPVWLISAELFCAINLYLAYQSWQNNPERTITQLLITNCGRVVSLGILLMLLGYKVKEIIWQWYDSLTLTLVIISISITALIISRQNIGIKDPIAQGTIDATLRAMPHLCMAYKIWLLGGQGLAPITIWSGLFLAFVRWGQIYQTIKQTGWDKPKKGLVISEGTSELTWTLVIVIWAYRYY